MFRHPLAMHRCCPDCGHQFDRGNGYFIGAMYASYALSLGLGIVTALAARLLTGSVGITVGAAAAVVLAAGPLWILPTSRVLWVWVERDGWLHDGAEDTETLKRAHLARHGMLPPEGRSSNKPNT